MGRLDKNGGFIEQGNRTRLNPRVLILEDRRVFYDFSRSDPSAPSETYEINLFLEEKFEAYGLFEKRFEKLYEDFKSIN